MASDTIKIIPKEKIIQANVSEIREKTNIFYSEYCNLLQYYYGDDYYEVSHLPLRIKEDLASILNNLIGVFNENIGYEFLSDIVIEKNTNIRNDAYVFDDFNGLINNLNFYYERYVVHIYQHIKYVNEEYELKIDVNNLKNKLYQIIDNNIDVLKAIKESKDLEKECKNFEKKVRLYDEKSDLECEISELCSKWRNISFEKEMAQIKDRVEVLKKQKSSLLFFAGKKKKALQEQIDAAYIEARALVAKADSERAALDEEIKNREKRIREINNELVMINSEEN